MRGARGIVTGGILLMGCMMALAPVHAQEEPAIEWLDVKRAYNQSKKEGKLLVLYLTKPSCPSCKRLEMEVLSSPEFNSYAGKAIFAKANPLEDETAGRIANSINCKGYPTLSLLRTSDDRMDEVGNILGYHPVGEYMEAFAYFFGTGNGPESSPKE